MQESLEIAEPERASDGNRLCCVTGPEHSMRVGTELAQYCLLCEWNHKTFRLGRVTYPTHRSGGYLVLHLRIC